MEFELDQLRLRVNNDGASRSLPRDVADAELP